MLDKARQILKTVFGYDDFRLNQEEVISAVMSGQDVFTSMPTGGGKSLCYQIPGLLFDGLTLVVSPLIALMKDQVDEAVSKGIPAAFLNSSLTSGEVADIYSRLERNEIKLLYLSPERLAVDGYLDSLKRFNISFVAVDEAHCLSEWGHDFRPDYLVLSRLRDTFSDITLAAFTATATRQVQDDIIRILDLKNPHIVRASFNRRELYYEVRPKRDVLTQIYEFVRERSGMSGIIYRTSRKETEKTALYLESKGIRAACYHAGLSAEERAFCQERFRRDEIDVVAATIAFGMGIDKSNIRYVIHGDLPKSMEGYYQETGRAGRDGVDSECLLLYSSGDIARQQYFIKQIRNPREQERSRENLKRIVRYATINVCRRKQILEYFDEDFDGNCGNCDICNGGDNKTEASIDARKLLSAVARTGESFGLSYIIDIVWGADTKKIRNNGHHTLKTFGVGNDKGKKWWHAVMDELIGQQAVYQDHERYNIIKFTDKGKDILFGRKEFYISRVNADSAGSVEKQKKRATNYEDIDEELFMELKEIRTRLAKESKVPPYIIFSDKTLINMCAVRPRNDKEFLEVSGVGEKKREVYGPQFLPVIQKHLED